MANLRTLLLMAGLLVVGTPLLLAESFYAYAASDEAPVPRPMPRTPVSQETIMEHKALPPSRDVNGAAIILDTEKLRVGDIEMRLFGVVPPQLSASFGPQARAVLDSLTAGTNTNCLIRDRDRDGRFLATCHGANNADLGLELLRRGLAVAARGSLQPTELVAPYMAAEQAAQAQKLGLWSVALPSAVSEASIHSVADAQKAADDKAAAENRAAAEKAAKDKATADAAAEKLAAEKAAKQTAKDLAVTPQQKPDTKAEKSKPPAPQTQADAVQQALSYETLDPTDTALDANALPEGGEPGFFARYQLLVTGLLMLLTATGIVLAFALQRRGEKRDERQSIAAALRGEMMAARAVCLARLHTIRDDLDEKYASWPRIRVLVFQAYVGRIGMLGAELARQIASIYGQASDYAAYYASNTNATNTNELITKRQALQTLVNHIEQVLPRLAHIEETGQRPSIPLTLPIVKKIKSHEVASETPPLALEQSQVAVEASSSNEEPDTKTSRDQSLPSTKETKHAEQPVLETTQSAHIPESTPSETNKESHKVNYKKASKYTFDSPPDSASTSVADNVQANSPTAATPSKSAQSNEKPASVAEPLWNVLRKWKGEHTAPPKDYMEDLIPDYINMTDDEIESLAYDKYEETEIVMPSSTKQHGKV